MVPLRYPHIENYHSNTHQDPGFQKKLFILVSSKIFILTLNGTLWILDRDHYIDLVTIVNIGVGHNVVVTLSIDVELIVVVVIVVEVVVDIGHNGEDVHGCGKESHLSNIHCCCISCCWTPSNKIIV